MSNMISQPPASIQLGGQGGPGAPGGPSKPGGGDGPDSQKVRDLIGQAVDLLRQAEDAEGDDADKAEIAKAVATLRAFIGAQQKMEDTAFGAGPGIKLMRKNPGGQAA